MIEKETKPEEDAARVCLHDREEHWQLAAEREQHLDGLCAGEDVRSRAARQELRAGRGPGDERHVSRAHQQRLRQQRQLDDSLGRRKPLRRLQKLQGRLRRVLEDKHLGMHKKYIQLIKKEKQPTTKQIYTKITFIYTPF
jgi:hypothetical protein